MAYDVNALYIELKDLKAKVQFYEQHHCRCFTKQQPSPPPNKEYSNKSLKIIRFKLESIDNLKVEADLRWKTAAIQLVLSVLKAKA
jgi:hypothetical protein